MKKRILFVILIGISFGINGQDETVNGKLVVTSNADVGRGQNPAFLIGDRAGKHIAIDDNEIGAFNNNANSVLYINASNSTSNTIINSDGTGNVGIGTTTPAQKLTVNGVIRSEKDASHYINLFVNGDNNGFFDLRGAASNNTMNFQINGGTKMVLNGSGNLTVHGNVGIGTTDTQGFKLAVKGNMVAERVKVALQPNWPDFVFSKDYPLPTLQEVEKYLVENGHLEEIPSAAEVKKEGFFLEEMDAKLLQKIEELTLYTIEQEKKIKFLEKQTARIEKLEHENTLLKSLAGRLTKLEERLKKKN